MRPSPYATHAARTGSLGRAAQGNFAGAIAQRNANFSANSYQRGMMLGGWNYAYRPNGGWVWYR